VILSAVGADATRELCERNHARWPPFTGEGASACRAVTVRGRDGRDSAIAASFGDEPAEVNVDGIGGGWQELAVAGDADDAERAAVRLGPLSVRLYAR